MAARPPPKVTGGGRSKPKSFWIILMLIPNEGG
jgi:hypothetical protein